VLTSSANPSLGKKHCDLHSDGVLFGRRNTKRNGEFLFGWNGTAKYSTNSLSAGTHSIVAVFTSTNPDFARSTSPAFTQFVSDFTDGVSPSSLTVARGGTYTLTLTPVGEFSGIGAFLWRSARRHHLCDLANASDTKRLRLRTNDCHDHCCSKCFQKNAHAGDYRTDAFAFVFVVYSLNSEVEESALGRDDRFVVTGFSSGVLHSVARCP